MKKGLEYPCLVSISIPVSFIRKFLVMPSYNDKHEHAHLDIYLPKWNTPSSPCSQIPTSLPVLLLGHKETPETVSEELKICWEKLFPLVQMEIVDKILPVYYISVSPNSSYYCTIFLSQLFHRTQCTVHGCKRVLTVISLHLLWRRC